MRESRKPMRANIHARDAANFVAMHNAIQGTNIAAKRMSSRSFGS